MSQVAEKADIIEPLEFVTTLGVVNVVVMVVVVGVIDEEDDENVAGEDDEDGHLKDIRDDVEEDC